MKPKRLVVFEPHKVGITRSSNAHRKLTKEGFSVSFGPAKDATSHEEVLGHLKKACPSGEKCYVTTSGRAKIGAEAMPQIEHIFVRSKGVDKGLLEAAHENGVKVSNISGHLGSSVAEHAVGLALAGMGDYIRHAEGLREGKWRKGVARKHTIAGSNVTVLGTGEVGSEIVRIVQGMGAKKVTGVNRSEKRIGKAKITKNKKNALKDAHIVFVALPHTAETEGSLGLDEFELMKENKPVIVNVGRAEVIDQEALEAAIKKGHISVFATDVHPDEADLIKGKKVRDLASLNDSVAVVQTPHIGYMSDSAVEGANNRNLENILAARKGKAKNLL